MQAFGIEEEGSYTRPMRPAAALEVNATIRPSRRRAQHAIAGGSQTESFLRESEKKGKREPLHRNKWWHLNHIPLTRRRRRVLRIYEARSTTQLMVYRLEMLETSALLCGYPRRSDDGGRFARALRVGDEDRRSAWYVLTNAAVSRGRRPAASPSRARRRAPRRLRELGGAGTKWHDRGDRVPARRAAVGSSRAARDVIDELVRSSGLQHFGARTHSESVQRTRSSRAERGQTTARAPTRRARVRERAVGWAQQADAQRARRDASVRGRSATVPPCSQRARSGSGVVEARR